MYLSPDRSYVKSWSGGDGITTQNPYSMKLTRLNNTRPETWENKYTGVPPAYYYWTFSGFGWHSSMGAPLSLAAWQNEEISALSKIADQLRTFDASVFLGTLGETVNMVVDRSTRVLNAYVDVKRGNYQRAARSLFGERGRKLTTGSPGQVWLEYQYGWAPLVHDVYEGCKAIKHITDNQSLTLRSRQARTVVTTVNTLGVKQHAKNCVQIIVKLDEMPGAMNRWGLKDPASLVWELLPWSFVVDWFVPVGDFLSTTSVLHGVRGTFVTSRMRKANIRHSYPVIKSGSLQFKNGVIDAEQVEFTRSISSSLSVPLPSIKTMEKAFSRGHLANAAALITQKVKMSRNATPY